MFKGQVIELLVEETKLSKEDVEKYLEVPPKLEMGDYAFPCFIFSNPKNTDEMWENVEKDFFNNKNPADIAKHFSDQINGKKLPKEIETIEARGPYVNFFVNKNLLAKNVLDITSNFGKGKEKSKILVEFCHANTHKAFHIGHTRNISLGESICRILERAGHKVVRANYQGDVGMHVAKALWGMNNLKELGLTIPEKDKGRWIGEVYAKSSSAAQDEKIAEEVNEVNRKLYQGDKKLLKLWKETRKWSIDYFEKYIYPDFGVKFDRFYFESEVEKKGSVIAKKLLEKGIAKKSKGAIIMDLKKYGLDVFLILKSDETPLYATKDLYLAELMNKEHKLDKILHIVAAEQGFYFKQLIKTLELTNPKLANQQEHLSYELVILPSGKMASREGIVVLYEDILKNVISIAEKGLKERDPDIDEKDLEMKAKKIALSAIKYSMLSQGHNKVITFDEKQAINFEGNTGPYLQYSYARASSILRKSKSKAKHKIPEKFEQSELALISNISKFPEIVKESSKFMNPSIIASYSFELAKSFNEFYHDCKVIGSNEESFRLKLIGSFRTVLKNALYLLGIDVLEEM